MLHTVRREKGSGGGWASVAQHRLRLVVLARYPDERLDINKVARAEGWRIMRFDRLGPILKLGGAALAVALVGGGGGYAFARLRPQQTPRRRLPLV